MKPTLFLSALGLAFAQDQEIQKTGFLAFAEKSLDFFKNNLIPQFLFGGITKQVLLLPKLGFGGGKKFRGHKHKNSGKGTKGGHHKYKHKQWLANKMLAAAQDSKASEFDIAALGEMLKEIKQQTQLNSTSTTSPKKNIGHRHNHKKNSKK